MDFSLKDIDKLDIFSKTTIISIIVLMPFWYVSLYLFHKQFYKDSDIYLKIIFSFCFSITWYFVNIIFLIVENSILNRTNDLQNIFKASGFLSVLFISTLIMIYYRQTTSFKDFLYKDYIYLTSFFILSIIVEKLFSKRKSKL